MTRRPCALALLVTVALTAGGACAAVRGLPDPKAPSGEAPRHDRTHQDSNGRGPHDATSTHPFDDVERWAGIFDDPSRDEWQNPGEVVRALGLRPGQTVADLGAGTGYFLAHLSRAVGGEGTVWALDTEPKMVEYMTHRAGREGLENVRAQVCPTDATGLPDGSADAVLIVDTFHHFDERLSYLRQLKSVLSRGGRVAVVDWDREAPPPPGPPSEHRLTREHIISEFDATGWRLVDEHTFLPHQVFLVFSPKSRDR